MRPTPAESERELLLTVARVLRALIDDPTPRADDHLYLEALDKALAPFKSSPSRDPLDGKPVSEGGWKPAQSSGSWI